MNGRRGVVVCSEWLEVARAGCSFVPASALRGSWLLSSFGLQPLNSVLNLDTCASSLFNYLRHLDSEQTETYSLKNKQTIGGAAIELRSLSSRASGDATTNPHLQKSQDILLEHPR